MKCKGCDKQVWAKERCGTYYTREWRRKVRTQTLEHYGGECACCGETYPDFLTIDHTGGGGNAHRREKGVDPNIGIWLKRNDWPKGFRVLCHNCNCAIGFYGSCRKHNV